MSRPPEQELARLYRYRDDLPDTTLCEFIEKENLLIINSRLWFELEPYEQRAISRTPRTIIRAPIVTDTMDDEFDQAA